MYMLEFNYSSENERKRIEYLLSRLSKGSRKLRAYSYVVDDEAFESIRTEIMEKFPEEAVSIYKLDPVEFKRHDVRADSIIETKRSESEVSSFLNYLLSKKRGVFEGNDPLGGSIYKVYTRKGLVWVKFLVRSKGQTVLKISFDGPEEAVESLRGEFLREIAVYLESG